jgi:hypothetical protein
MQVQGGTVLEKLSLLAQRAPTMVRLIKQPLLPANLPVWVAMHKEPAITSKPLALPTLQLSPRAKAVA